MLRSPLEKINTLYLRIFDSEFMRRILRNSSYLVSATVITAGIGFVQNYFQFQVLKPAGVGLLAAMAAFTNVINRFTAFRIDELVIKYVRLYIERKEPQKAAAVYKLAALLEAGGAILAFGLIYGLAPVGVQFFSDVSGVEALFVLYGSLVLINLTYDSSDGILQVFNRFDAKSIIDVCQSLLRLGLTVWVFFSGGGLMEFILAELAGRLLRSLAVIVLALRTAKREWGAGWWRTPISVLQSDRRSLLTFAFSTNMSATVSLVAKDSEDLWVNAFLGNVSGGIYAAARSLIGLLQIPISPLPSTTYPELSRAVAQDNWKAVRGVLRRGSLLAALYSLPVAVVLILFGRQVITLYQGVDFLPAYAPLVILTLGYTVVNLFYWSRAALLAFNRPVYPTLVNLAGMLLKIAGVFALAQYGAVGFATLLSGYYLFTVGLSVLRINKDLRTNLARVS
ncbi:MAG TPA: oligosaccharide flippase family protein [Anaerolineales bacterium]|nr:oligosaccharide flippase family protein [Anaerolineales bacterium]HRQ92645.1 oligosaccharide flippase family protein [Anaerolineales bacterium]